MTIVKSRIERQFQEEWKGLIGIYLFLGGLGGGAYVVAGVGSLLGAAWAPLVEGALWVSWIALGVGLLFLMSHLGKPFRAMLAMSKVGSSWISRGVWIFGIFGILAVIHWYTVVMGGGEAPAILSILGMLFATLTMLYTGALLSAAKGFPFWRTGLLPILFLISGLLTGMFAAIIVALAPGGELTVANLNKLAAIGAGLCLIELLAVFFFLHASYKMRDTQEAAKKMISKGSFVFGDLILGLIVPMGICFAVYFAMDDVAQMGTMMMIASALGLLGGFLLRYAILSTGMQNSLDFAGFKFRPIAKLDFERAPIGKFPPQ